MAWLPFEKISGASASPRLEFAPGFSTQASFNDANTVTGNMLSANGTRSPFRYDVGSNSIVPLGVLAWYNTLPEGIQMVGFEFTNIPPMVGNATDQFAIFHAWASNWNKVGEPTVVTAESMFISNNQGTANNLLFQATTQGDVYAGTFKALSGSQGFSSFRFNKASFIPGSLCAVLQGGVNNQSSANVLTLVQGPDLGTNSFGICILKDYTPVAQDATTITYSFAKPNGGQGLIRGFTWWPL